MVKINKLINEPYISSEYIKEVFLNPNISPSDIVMYTSDVIANHLVSCIITQDKSNFRFLMNNYSRQELEEKNREELISSLVNKIEENLLFQIYRDTCFSKRKKQKDGTNLLEEFVTQMLVLPLNRESFDKYSIQKKLELIKIKELETYSGNRDVSLLIETMKKNNQAKRNKNAN